MGVQGQAEIHNETLSQKIKNIFKFLVESTNADAQDTEGLCNENRSVGVLRAFLSI